MTENTSSYTNHYLRDGTLVALTLSSASYFYGSMYFKYFWYNLGLSVSVQPDVTVEEIMMRGGGMIVLSCFLFLLFYGIYSLSRAIKAPPKEDCASSTKRYNLAVKVCGIVMLYSIPLYISVHLAWLNSHNLLAGDIKTIDSISPESSHNLSNPKELAFLGYKNSYLVMLRIDGDKAGEVTLIAESEVKSLTVR